mmetsp:Transcript_73530/g.227078  ORF Transcript_73530/g.227078 Transcript_73530/m.227078 type:complete len:440 (+) Transcript_73530:53-1372(+)
MSVFDGAKDIPRSSNEAKSAAALFLIVGGVFMLTAVPSTLIVFTGPKMAAEPGGLSMEAISSCQALYFVGWASASVLIMPRVDRSRRRTPAYSLLAVNVVAAYASTCISSARSYSLCLFLMGMCLPTCGQLLYLMLTESVPGWFKSAVAGSLNAGFSALVVLVAAFCAGAVDMDWRTESRLLYSPFALFLLLGVLYVQDPAPSRTSDGPEGGKAAEGAATGLGQAWSPELRVRTAATCFCWSACSVSYYGLTYSAGNLSDDVYVNVGLLGVVDVVAYLAAVALIRPFGPRTAQIMSFVGAGLALLACSIAPHGSWMLVTWVLVGRFFVNVAFSTCYLLLVTCFPAESRCAVSGMANFCARLSSLLAPFCTVLPVSLCCTLLSALVLVAAGATTALPARDIDLEGEEEGLREAWLGTDREAVDPEEQKHRNAGTASLLRL